MTDSFWSWTLADFRDRIASAQPQPSGGPVAAVSATFGLGLVVMCLEITRAGEPNTALDALLASGRELLERLGAHADRDASAYSKFMVAMALPKETVEERAVRRQRMQEAVTAATESPLATARDITAALDLGAQTALVCKPRILSDLSAGIDLLVASLSAVLGVADANLSGIADAVLQKRLRQERAALATSGAERATSIQTTLGTRLHGR